MTPSNSLFLARTTNVALARGLAASVSGSRQPFTNTLSCFSLILLQAQGPSVMRTHFGACKSRITYRMAGGAPAGINILPGELGCRTNSTKIRTTTSRGNIKTTPNGTDIVEFPRKRNGRRKKASPDETVFRFDPFLFSSCAGRCSF